jgi:hypothetical protein
MEANATTFMLPFSPAHSHTHTARTGQKSYCLFLTRRVNILAHKLMS